MEATLRGVRPDSDQPAVAVAIEALSVAYGEGRRTLESIGAAGGLPQKFDRSGQVPDIGDLLGRDYSILPEDSYGRLWSALVLGSVPARLAAAELLWWQDRLVEVRERLSLAGVRGRARIMDSEVLRAAVRDTILRAEATAQLSHKLD